MFGDAVNAFVELAVPWPTPRSLAYWRNVACLAVAEATGRPPGPVHVNVSFRDPASCSAATQRSARAGTGGRPDGRPWTDVSRGELRPSDDDVARLAAFVLEHQRGFVVAAGARAQDAGPIHELAARAGWPVIGEPGSGVRHGPHVLATIEALLRAGATRDSAPDAVLRFGGPPLTAGLADLLGKGREVVVDADLSWPDPSRRVEWMLRADGGAVCEAVNRVLPPTTPSAWADHWLDAEARMRAALVGALEDEPGLTEPLVVREVAASVPPGGALVVGPSMPLRDLDWFMAPRDDIRVLANRGANGIDGFASTALGIALAGDAPVVAVAGDLTVLHDQNGLLAARALGGSLVLVVVNNDGGGIFAFSPAADGSEEFDAVFAAGTRADFAGLAQTIGAEHERPESVAELRRALARRPPVGVRLVEVRTDRAENVAVHARIWQRAAARFTAAPADVQAGAPV